jgi:hypothetical protein
MVTESSGITDRVAENLKARIGGMSRYELVGGLSASGGVNAYLMCIETTITSGAVIEIVCHLGINYSFAGMDDILHGEMVAAATEGEMTDDLFTAFLKFTTREKIAAAQENTKNMLSLFRTSCKN